MNRHDPGNSSLAQTPDADPLDAMVRLLDRPVSEASLSAAAQIASQPVECRTQATVGILIFRLGPETLALPARSLRRVTTYARPSPIPYRKSGILRGVSSIRGELILCADMRRLLDLPAIEESAPRVQLDSDPRRMIVIGPPEASWVFEVDSLVGIERIDSASLIPPPLTVARAEGKFVSGLAEVDGSRITILDDKRVLAGLEAGLS